MAVRLTINTREHSIMKLSQLIAVVGDENVIMQSLAEDTREARIESKGAWVSFNTAKQYASALIGIGVPEFQGHVLWLPIDKMRVNLAMHIWDVAIAAAVGASLTLDELLDSMKAQGFDEGEWDGLSDSIEELPYIQMDEDCVYTDTRPLKSVTQPEESREERSAQMIVDQTNELARELYRIRGYEAPKGYRFDQATHPHEIEAWRGACEAQEMLTSTDPQDALDELEG